MELQLGSFDTSNCQLLLEREGHEGTPMEPGVGGQAKPLTAWGWAHGHSLAETLFCSTHQGCLLNFTSSGVLGQLIHQGTDAPHMMFQPPVSPESLGRDGLSASFADTPWLAGLPAGF